MPDVLIENPILNSPFEQPNRHFKFTEDGITNEVVEARRSSGYFVPIPQPKKKGKQLVFDSEWTQDRFRESEFINRVRDRVNVWRQQGWPGVTNTTAKLLQHWTDPEPELEDMPEVIAYVKSYNLGFTIPYTIDDRVHQYNPDYLVRVDDGRGAENPLNLVLEVTGEKKKDKEAKVDSARRLWIPAINNDGRFGRWAFLEIKDPWSAQTEIRALLKTLREGRAA